MMLWTIQLSTLSKPHKPTPGIISSIVMSGPLQRATTRPQLRLSWHSCANFSLFIGSWNARVTLSWLVDVEILFSNNLICLCYFFFTTEHSVDQGSRHSVAVQIRDSVGSYSTSRCQLGWFFRYQGRSTQLYFGGLGWQRLSASFRFGCPESIEQGHGSSGIV